MKTIHRRQFWGHTLLAGSAVALPWLIPARVLGRDGAVAPLAFATRLKAVLVIAGSPKNGSSTALRARLA